MKLEDFEIVGFNGAAMGYCAEKQPLAQIKGEDKYFIISSIKAESEPDEFLSGVEIKHLECVRLLTLFSPPVPSTKNAKVVYVTKHFLRAFSYMNPEELSPNFIWREVSADFENKFDTPEYAAEKRRLTEGTWATSANASLLREEMDRWATKLMRMATDRLIVYYSVRNRDYCDEAERLANMALYAAQSKKLRARIYLRYGAAIIESNDEDQLDNVFEQIIKREFNWNWETYRTRVHRFIDSLRIKSPTYNPDPVAQDNILKIPISPDDPDTLGIIEDEVNYHLKRLKAPFHGDDIESLIDDIDRVGSNFALYSHTKDVKEMAVDADIIARVINQIADKSKRYEVCKKVARECRDQFNLDEMTILRVAEKINNASHTYILDKQSLQVLTTSSAFFFKPVLEIRLDLPPLFNINSFAIAVDEIGASQSLDWVATLITEGVSPNTVAP